MSNKIMSVSIASSFLCAAALMLAASSAAAQRPSSGQGDPQRPPPQDAPPPPPTRPQTPPPPPPQDARAQQQREANARAQQQQEANARAQQQEAQRIEKARQEQAAQDQARIARARQAQETAAADPKYRDVIGRLMAAERVHREQLARINRLKQIAQRQGQNDRVSDLDRLLVGSNKNFERALEAAKPELPEPQFSNTVAMLEQGRRREVRQMMGADAGPVKLERVPSGGAVQAPERVPTPQRQKAPEPSQPPR